MTENITTNESKFINAKFKFNPEGYWKNPIPESKHCLYKNGIPNSNLIALFDQNGYDLTELEKIYSLYNDTDFFSHREHRFAIKKPWFHQIPEPIEGPVINHCYLFERKGYSETALEQLKKFALGTEDIPGNPLFYKLIAIRPKWGIDFSLDYVGRDGKGNMIVCEIFHYEWDSFNYEEAEEMKQKVEKLIEETDWNIATSQLLLRKSEWEHLGFFEQSDYKCKFFGLPSEKFKMVTWK